MGNTRVMLSVKPKWCELIVRGEKSVEVRKTRPKIPTPFKCYIYCTVGSPTLNIPISDERLRADILVNGMKSMNCPIGNGKVIGEFVCDRIDDIMISCSDPHMRGIPFPETGMSDREIMDYLGNGKTGYGWHFSEQVIYATPRKLGEFSGTRESYLKRPPQSWCYVEELRYG